MSKLTQMVDGTLCSFCEEPVRQADGTGSLWSCRCRRGDLAERKRDEVDRWHPPATRDVRWASIARNVARGWAVRQTGREPELDEDRVEALARLQAVRFGRNPDDWRDFADAVRERDARQARDRLMEPRGGVQEWIRPQHRNPMEDRVPFRG